MVEIEYMERMSAYFIQNLKLTFEKYNEFLEFTELDKLFETKEDQEYFWSKMLKFSEEKNLISEETCKTALSHIFNTNGEKSFISFDRIDLDSEESIAEDNSPNDKSDQNLRKNFIFENFIMHDHPDKQEKKIKIKSNLFLKSVEFKDYIEVRKLLSLIEINKIDKITMEKLHEITNSNNIFNEDLDRIFSILRCLLDNDGSSINEDLIIIEKKRLIEIIKNLDDYINPILINSKINMNKVSTNAIENLDDVIKASSQSKNFLNIIIEYCQHIHELISLDLTNSVSNLYKNETIKSSSKINIVNDLEDTIIKVKGVNFYLQNWKNNILIFNEKLSFLRSQIIAYEDKIKSLENSTNIIKKDDDSFKILEDLGKENNQLNLQIQSDHKRIDELNSNLVEKEKIISNLNNHLTILKERDKIVTDNNLYLEKCLSESQKINEDLKNKIIIPNTPDINNSLKKLNKRNRSMYAFKFEEEYTSKNYSYEDLVTIILKMEDSIKKIEEEKKEFEKKLELQNEVILTQKSKISRKNEKIRQLKEKNFELVKNRNSLEFRNGHKGLKVVRRLSMFNQHSLKFGEESFSSSSESNESFHRQDTKIRLSGLDQVAVNCRKPTKLYTCEEEFNDNLLAYLQDDLKGKTNKNIIIESINELNYSVVNTINFELISTKIKGVISIQKAIKFDLIHFKLKSKRIQLRITAIRIQINQYRLVKYPSICKETDIMFKSYKSLYSENLDKNSELHAEKLSFNGFYTPNKNQGKDKEVSTNFQEETKKDFSGFVCEYLSFPSLRDKSDDRMSLVSEIIQDKNIDYRSRNSRRTNKSIRESVRSVKPFIQENIQLNFTFPVEVLDHKLKKISKVLVVKDHQFYLINKKSSDADLSVGISSISKVTITNSFCNLLIIHIKEKDDVIIEILSRYKFLIFLKNLMESLNLRLIFEVTDKFSIKRGGKEIGISKNILSKILLPINLENTLKIGFLEKYSNNFLANKFEVKFVAVTNCGILIFNDLNTNKLESLITISGSEIEKIPPVKYKKKFCFEIKNSRGEYSTFAGNSDEDRESWVQALTELNSTSVRNIANIFEQQ